MKKVALLFAAFVFLAQTVSAKNLDKPCARKEGKGIVKALKLTSDQEKKFDDININHQKAMVDVRAKIEKNQIELKSMLKEGNIDEKKLLQLTNENSKMKAEMKEAGIEKWIEINKMLDKDQKEVWAKHLAKFAGSAKMMKDKIKAEAKYFFKKQGVRKKMMEHKDSCCELTKESSK
ncbi:MAG: hypothetical protein FD143_665 [Ignavibacteria bacterium]|nr:MAG: hypothetical protein FD143_665 [Ignavibacteria bacterium]KAF0161278.1 MAG: hypothetical protein FD188_866 [Ignavibacteria bacterium]